MTNIFIFESSPNTKPKDKKVGGHGILCPPAWKSGGTCPPCPPPNCAHATIISKHTVYPFVRFSDHRYCPECIRKRATAFI